MNKQYSNGLASALGAVERSGGERSEPECSSPAPNAADPQPPSPEVRPRAQRRRFTQQTKLAFGAGDVSQGQSLAKGAGVKLHHWRAKGLRHRHLHRMRIDEERHPGPGIAQSPDEGGHGAVVTRHIQAALGGPLLPTLGNEADRMRPRADGDGEHLVGAGHL